MAGHAIPLGNAPVLRRFLACTAALAGLLAAGCVSADLSGDSKTAGDVADCLPPGTATPSVVARAIWFPNANGFGSADETGMGHLVGVLALAGDKLWFMTWDDTVHQFSMRHVVEVLPAAKVEVASLGSASMLVIESRNRSFDSYELMYGQELGSDSKATQDLLGKIQALRLKFPDVDP
jgi:hypothetical protein